MREYHPGFICDCMCRGAARGLRAWGYYARWSYGITGSEVIDAAVREGMIIVTGDAGLPARRIVTTGEVRAVHLPAGLDRWQQAAAVIRTFGLERRDPRCMHCGGNLDKADKKNHQDELPPRTYAWLDEFRRCGECGRFFWKGTHWERIEVRLDAMHKGVVIDGAAQD